MKTKDQAVFSLGCQTNAQGEGNPYPSRNAPNGIKPGDTELTVPFGGSPWQLFFDDEILDDIFSEEGDESGEFILYRRNGRKKSGSIITNKPFVRKYQNGPDQCGERLGYRLDHAALYGCLYVVCRGSLSYE